MLKFFRIPFASSGDKTAVPDAVDVNGFVSYTAGYGFDYQRQKTDPASKNIERDKMNEIFYDITKAIAELQSQGVPDFITSALNGGTAYSYPANAVVMYSGDIYQSLVAANTALPTDATKWALLPTTQRLQAAYATSCAAGGTADALTGVFVFAPTAYPAAPGTQKWLVRAASANATTTPTFTPNSGTLAAKTIVKGSNQALAPGDIAGAGHWLDLMYDATLDKFVLLNPATSPKTSQGANIASAATLNLDSSTGNYVHVTGTTSVTAITLAQGSERTVVFDAALTLTNGASLILPGGLNVTTTAGDSAVFRGEAGGVVRCVSYTYATNKSIQDVTASRVIGTTYTNNTPRQIDVSISMSIASAATNPVAILTVNGNPFYGSVVPVNGASSSVSAPVPPGGTYSVNPSGSTGTLIKWLENR